MARKWVLWIPLLMLTGPVGLVFLLIVWLSDRQADRHRQAEVEAHLQRRVDEILGSGPLRDPSE
ncbi:MAG: hypothetical protein ACRDHF_04390 [Tepidiformaceae bacterium]